MGQLADVGFRCIRESNVSTRRDREWIAPLDEEARAAGLRGWLRPGHDRFAGGQAWMGDFNSMVNAYGARAIDLHQVSGPTFHNDFGS